jgi:hypothetical protein
VLVVADDQDDGVGGLAGDLLAERVGAYGWLAVARLTPRPTY